MISSDSAMILVKNYTYLPICRYLMISPTKIVLISPGKGHAHRWDLLTSSKKFKGLIDKDGEDPGVWDFDESIWRFPEMEVPQ